MFDKIKSFFAFIDALPRARILFDKSAWLLIAPALIAVYLADPAMALTLGKWGLFALVLAGVSVMVSRLVFPQINLGELVDSARTSDNRAAAVIVASVVIFVGLLFIGMVLWAKV